MTLPSEVCFRSAGYIHPDDDDDSIAGGFHLQYQIKQTLVNLVILSLVDSIETLSNVEDSLIEKLNEASIYQEGDVDPLSMEFNDKLDHIYDEIQTWMDDQCRPVLLEIVKTAKSPDKNVPMTVHQYLHPEIVNIQLKTVDGEVSLIQFEDTPSWPSGVNLGHPSSAKFQLPENGNFPTFLSRHVNLAEEDAVPRVIINGEVVRCKLNMAESSAEREHRIYLKIAEIGLSDLRIPTFKGYIKEEMDTEVLGFLLEDIDTKHPTLVDAMGDAEFRLPNVQPEFPCLERRRKWANQIKAIVQKLHDHEVVWGDVKPENVVIDRNDNAWVIDFGGGCTLPWRPFGEEESKEADWKAIELIQQYLETGELPPMPNKIAGCRSLHNGQDADGDELDQTHTSNLNSGQGIDNFEAKQRDPAQSPRKRKRTSTDEKEAIEENGSRSEDD